MTEQIEKAQPFAKAGLCVALIIAGLLLLFGGNQKYTAQPLLIGKAEAATEEGIDRNMKAFATVTMIKAGLSVIEGSSVGAGFSIEVGDVVQPALDRMDLLWDTLLYSLLILTFYEILLNTGFIASTLPVVGVGCLLWAIGLYVPQSRFGFRRLARLFVFVGLLFAYLVPVALLASHHATNEYLQPLREPREAELRDISGMLEGTREELSKMKAEINPLSPLSSLDKVQRRMGTLFESIKVSLNQSVRTVFYLAVLYILDFALPVLIALLMYKVLQLAFSRFLEDMKKPRSSTQKVDATGND